MRINAYVLAGDPWFLEESVLSYYSAVDRIVVSYDVRSRSWTGTPLPVEECLARLRAIDTQGKCDFVGGDYFLEGRSPMENDTAQRNAAVRAASAGCDWVLQLDTDEVAGDLDLLLSCLNDADEREADGLDFPARYFYLRTKRGRFLELATRTWRAYAHYPGPIAVRAGTVLRFARQADVPLFRVDFRATNTSPHHPRDVAVDRVVPLASGIRHYSWVRSIEYMRRKANWSGHTAEYSARYGQWEWRLRHPLLAVLMTPFRHQPDRYRYANLPPDQRTWRGESDSLDYVGETALHPLEDQQPPQNDHEGG